MRTKIIFWMAFCLSISGCNEKKLDGIWVVGGIDKGICLLDFSETSVKLIFGADSINIAPYALGENSLTIGGKTVEIDSLFENRLVFSDGTFIKKVDNSNYYTSLNANLFDILITGCWELESSRTGKFFVDFTKNSKVVYSHETNLDYLELADWQYFIYEKIHFLILDELSRSIIQLNQIDENMLQGNIINKPEMETIAIESSSHNNSDLLELLIGEWKNTNEKAIIKEMSFFKNGPIFEFFLETTSNNVTGIFNLGCLDFVFLGKLNQESDLLRVMMINSDSLIIQSQRKKEIFLRDSNVFF